jgi:hypothetical protein
VDYKNNN